MGTAEPTAPHTLPPSPVSPLRHPAPRRGPPWLSMRHVPSSPRSPRTGGLGGPADAAYSPEATQGQFAGSRSRRDRSPGAPTGLSPPRRSSSASGSDPALRRAAPLRPAPPCRADQSPPLSPALRATPLAEGARPMGRGVGVGVAFPAPSRWPRSDTRGLSRRRAVVEGHR